MTIRADANEIGYGRKNRTHWTDAEGDLVDALDELASRLTTEEGLHPDTSTDNGLARYTGTSGALQDTPHLKCWDESVGALDLHSTNVSGGAYNLYSHLGDAGTGGGLGFWTAYGTEASPAVIENGTELGHIDFRGHTGGAYINAAEMVAQATEAWGLTDCGTEIAFRTTENGAFSSTLRLTIANDGTLNLHGNALSNVGNFTAANQFLVSSAASTPAAKYRFAAYKTADETKNSDNSYTADDDLVCTLPASSYFSFRMNLIWAAHVDAGFKAKVAVPSNGELCAGGHWGKTQTGAGHEPIAKDISASLGLLMDPGTSGVPYLYQLIGWINSGDGGTFSIEWGQHNSDANDTTMYKGSMFELVEF